MSAPRLRLVARLVPAALACLLLVGAGCRASLEDRLAEVQAMHDVGEFRESIAPLREILAEAPEHAEANYRLGLALSRVGQNNSAVWPLQRAAETEQFAIPANYALATLYLTLQDYDRALATLDRVLEREPQHTQSLSLRAKVNLEAKRQAAALADLERVLELAPEDLQALYTRAVALGELGRVAESEAAHRRFLEVARESEQPGLEARACTALALHYRDYAKDAARGEQELLGCLARHPDDSFVVRQMLDLYDRSERRPDALALARRYYDANPGDLARRVALANRLRNDGHGDEAEALMREAVEVTGGMAERLALAQFHRSGGDAEAALRAIEEVIAETGGPHNDDGRFTYADALLDAERIEQAEKVAADIDDPIYRQLLQGRILLMRDDPAAALRVLEPAVENWPDNPGARFLAGMAALRSGAAERAVAHLREAVRSGAGDTDASLLLARLYLERGEPEEAARFAKSHLDRRNAERPEGYVLRARALLAAKRPELAAETVDELAKRGFPVEAAVERAHLAREKDGPAAALAVIEKSGLDLTEAAHQAPLRSAVEDLIALGRAEEARTRAEAAARANPDSAAHQAILGSVQARRGDAAAARRALERALELDAENATALAGLGTLEALDGRRERAVALFDRAATADPDNWEPAYSAAQLVLAAGNREEAQRRLSEIADRHPGAAGARNDLAWLLADSGGDLDRALALAKEAVRLDPQPAILDTLGYVHLKREEPKRAAAVFERALAAQPDAPSTRYHLGVALARLGDAEGASRAFRAALDAGAFPEAEAARRELDRLAKP